MEPNIRCMQKCQPIHRGELKKKLRTVDLGWMFACDYFVCLVPHSMATSDPRVVWDPARHCHGEPMSAHIWQGVGEGPFRTQETERQKSTRAAVSGQTQIGKTPSIARGECPPFYLIPILQRYFCNTLFVTSVCGQVVFWDGRECDIACHSHC